VGERGHGATKRLLPAQGINCYAASNRSDPRRWVAKHILICPGREGALKGFLNGVLSELQIGRVPGDRTKDLRPVSTEYAL
jgi:hypothetical protein